MVFAKIFFTATINWNGYKSFSGQERLCMKALLVQLGAHSPRLKWEVNVTVHLKWYRSIFTRKDNSSVILKYV